MAFVPLATQFRAMLSKSDLEQPGSSPGKRKRAQAASSKGQWEVLLVAVAGPAWRVREQERTVGFTLLDSLG